MTIKINQISDFIFSYTKEYRAAYKKVTGLPPEGLGYPDCVSSIYIEAKTFDVYICTDGVVNSWESEPEHQWYIVGGPALKVDYEPTRTPTEVTDFLRENNLLGQFIGIYRIVASNPLASCVWRSRIQKQCTSTTNNDEDLNLKLNIYLINASVKEVVNILTFGAFGTVIEARLPSNETTFGSSRTWKNIGFFPADLNNRRFFKHLEAFPHIDDAAWDQRIIKLRVQQDLRRDLAEALTPKNPTHAGGTMSFHEEPSWLEAYSSQLDSLRSAIDELGNALKFQSDEVESVFHEIIEKHPLLLDVYGITESKPEFHYPQHATSPVGKSKLQPDFLIRYPDQSYKLIEIERPTKKVTTSQGQPRAEVSQAVFQTAEWKHFIKTHYQTIATRYPGIQAKCKTAVIMSRFTQSHFNSATDAREYMGLMMDQFRIDEFLTFDDLLERAITAYTMLSNLHSK